MTARGEARVTAAIVSNDLTLALELSRTSIRHGRHNRLTAPSMAWGFWPLLEAVTGDGGDAAVVEARQA
jgi:hypothetical protein